MISQHKVMVVRSIVAFDRKMHTNVGVEFSVANGVISDWFTLILSVTRVTMNTL